MKKMLAGSILALMPTLALAGGHSGLGAVSYTHLTLPTNREV